MLLPGWASSRLSRASRLLLEGFCEVRRDMVWRQSHYRLCDHTALRDTQSGVPQLLLHRLLHRLHVKAACPSWGPSRWWGNRAMLRN
jgi:hypothetical protein